MSNNKSQNKPQSSHSQSQNAQGPWWELLSPHTPGFTRQETQTKVTKKKTRKKKRSKCHGNKKLQHFKRKCRVRGLTNDQINALVQARGETLTKQLNKRKRDSSEKDNTINNSIKSLSQLSISQEEARKKKMKKTTTDERVSNDHQTMDRNQIESTLHKVSKYLKTPLRLLLTSLQHQLNYPLKKNKLEQDYILARLPLFDRQFCLNRVHYLYRTYFELGMEHQIWPVSWRKFLYL